MNIDCIYFKEHEEDSDWPECVECIRTSRLSDKEQDDLCNNCRLYDAYIPEDTPQDIIEYAQAWDKMSYKEQPDYEEYFKGMI